MIAQSNQGSLSPVAIPEELFLPSARIKLYPFVVWQKNAKDYLLMRLGCRKITMLSTTHPGVVASRLLKCGYSAAEVSTRLSSVLKRDGANIQPLLKALYEAQMIRAINGRIIEPAAPSPGRQLKQRLEYLRIRSRAALTRMFVRSFPVAITHRTMCFLEASRSNKTTRAGHAQVEMNLSSVFGGSLSAKQIRRLALEFAKEKVGRDIDLELLTELPELQVGKWLRSHCEFHGLEHLDGALAKQEGVLLSSFHFSSSHLLVLLLWLRGYSFTGAGGIPWNNQGRVLPSDNPELALQLKGCGDVKWYAKFTLQSALDICRTVNRGGMGLVFPDGSASYGNGDVAKHLGHDAALYKRAQCEVPFLGRMVQANTGVPWIYKQSRAPLIPVKLVRDSFHRFQVIVGPEIKLDRAASLEKVTADLYGTLEREIRQDPAAWIYWRILDQFSTTS